MSEAKQKVLLILFGNPGGDGKTWLARGFEAVGRKLERSVQLVCADAGNGSLRQVFQMSSGVTWGAAPEIGGQIVAAYRETELLIIDCGANSSTTAYNIIDLLLQARQEAERQGRRAIAVIPIGTNKPGSAGMADISKKAFRQAGFETHLILNNRDGSSEYLGIEREGLPEVPHLQPGFVSLLNQHAGGWYELMLSPPDGFTLALDFVAEWLEAFSRLEPVRQCLAIKDGGIDFGRRSPKVLQRRVASLASSADQALLANEAYRYALADLRQCTEGDPALWDKVSRFQNLY